MTANSDESIQNIRVIDSVQINKEKNISEVLRNIPGVNIKRSSGIASFTYRGLPSRYSLILINGTRVNDSSSVDDSFDLNSIDISEVKKIEVMTGPAALAYGTSAVASVINIITNDYKNQLSTIQGFRQRYQVDKSFLTMNTSTHIGSFYEEQEQLSAAVNTEEKDLVIKKGVSLGHEWVTEKDSYKLSSLFNEYYNQIDAYIGSEFSDVEDVDVVKRIGLVNFEFKNERWSFSQNFYYNNRDSRTLMLDNPVRTNFTSKNSLSSLEYKAIDHFIFGYNLELERATVDSRFKRDVNSLYSIYQNRYKNFSYSFSTRFENFDDNSVLAYSAGLLQSVGQNYFRLNYSSGYKRASFYQLYSADFGNSSLENEKTQVIDLSYQYKNLLKLSFFYNYINDVIGFNTQYENQDVLISKGIELKISKSYRFNRIELGASFIESKKNDSNNTLSNIPKEGYFLSWSRDFNTLGLDLRFNHVGIRKEGTESLSAYNLVSLSATRSVLNMQLRFSIFNFLNQSYQEAKDFSRPSRNYELELSYKF